MVLIFVHVIELVRPVRPWLLNSLIDTVIVYLKRKISENIMAIRAHVLYFEGFVKIRHFFYILSRVFFPNYRFFID